MVTIEFNNNKGQLRGNPVVLSELFEEVKIRDPNAFHLRKYMPKGWDGKRKYITDYGSFKTGLMPKLLVKIKALGEDNVKLVDNRNINFSFKGLEKRLSVINFRPYQLEAIKTIYYNKLMGLPFPVGILKEATNAGKTYIIAGLFLAFREQQTLVTINATDLYNQLVVELEELLPGKVGRIDPKKTDIDKPLVIGKVGTMSSHHRKGKYDKFLATIQTLLVDECDLADNKSYKGIITKCFNSWVRVGMSGTVYEGKLAKFRIPHENIREMFSEQLHVTTNRELIDKGHSSEVIIKILKGNQTVKIKGNYAEEYEQGIVENKERNKLILNRIGFHASHKRLPALIIVKKKKHVRILYRMCKKEFPSFKIRWVHSGRPDKVRKKVFEDFKEGRTDLLISSMVTKRGMNLKLLQFLMNAGGGDNPANPLQILGRAMRKHTNEKITHKHFEDFLDEGFYLKRHSKHRITYYKDQELEIQMPK